MIAEVRELEARGCKLSFGRATGADVIPDRIWVTIYVSGRTDIEIDGIGDTIDEAFLDAVRQYEVDHERLCDPEPAREEDG